MPSPSLTQCSAAHLHCRVSYRPLRWAALYLAAQGGHKEVVRLLLEDGADPNVWEVIRLLLEDGVGSNIEESTKRRRCTWEFSLAPVDNSVESFISSKPCPLRDSSWDGDLAALLSR